MEAFTETIGRRHNNSEKEIINPFISDFNKIVQSKAYRRLAYKTQVISTPDNPHVRTRLVHTNEVMGVSAMISTALNLNNYLCMAIAAGHDIGHTPYGHLGERVLSEEGGVPFKHYINSVVVAQHVERKAKGLNLTFETLEGILNHSRTNKQLTVNQNNPAEYSVVMFADKIAYTFSDLNDGIRYNYVNSKKLPDFITDLGYDQRERVETVVKDLIDESREKGYVDFSEGPIFEKFKKTRDYMHENFYHKVDSDLQKEMLHKVFNYVSEIEEFGDVNPIITMSLMTDNEAVEFGNLLLRSRKPSMNKVKHFGVFEIVPHLIGKNIDYTKTDLGWGQELKEKYLVNHNGFSN